MRGARFEKQIVVLLQDIRGAVRRAWRRRHEGFGILRFDGKTD
jgi:hypothetical protein